jgi:hypothetical protein
VEKGEVNTLRVKRKSSQSPVRFCKPAGYFRFPPCWNAFRF